MSSQLPESSTQVAPAQHVQPTFRVFRPPQGTNSTMSPELPDSYFTPTTADLKAAQNSLTARTQALVNTPLRTQIMRETELKLKQAKYPTVTIRIRFPDRTQLEKVFPSTDKIRSVYAFVRGSLREDVKAIKFVLYQTPPKRELKVSDLQVRDLTLLQLQLAPSSVLHLKFGEESLNHVDMPAPLDPVILAVAEDLPRPPIYEESPNSALPGPSTSQAKAGTSGIPAGKGTTKVPKWFKLGPNK